jgi:S-adenosylmethionine-dependent methyltransferase
MTVDADFDDRGDAFEAEVYGTSKGYVRLSVLWADMLSAIPSIDSGGLSVLDAGGGSGRIAVRLAASGNRVLLADPSDRMLSMAAKRVEERGVGEFVSTLLSGIDDLAEHVRDRFDLVTCHAVLEWLAEPEQAVRSLADFVQPRGTLSLMFYNRNAADLKQVLRGDFRKDPPSRQPVPLQEEVVLGWLDSAGLRVVSKAGIRIFHDHLDPAIVRDRLEELVALEKHYRSREPFASLAQHIHLVCERS